MTASDSSRFLFDQDAHSRALTHATQRALSTVFSVAFDRTGRFCVAATSLGSVHVFDLQPLMHESFWHKPRRSSDVAPSHSFVAHRDARIFAAAFASADVLLTAGDDGCLRAWSVAQLDSAASPALLFRLSVPARQFGSVAELNGVAVDAATRHAFGAAGDSLLYAWDLETQQCVRTFAGHTDYLHAVTLMPSGAPVTGAEDGTVRIWDCRAPDATTTLALPRSEATRHRAAYISSVAVSGDGQWLAAGGGANAAGLWHAPSQQLVTVLPHAAAVGALRFVQPGDVGVASKAAGSDANSLGNVASGSGGLVSGDIGSGTLCHWQLDGTLRMRVATHASAVYSVVLNQPAQYRMLACAGLGPKIDLFFGNLAKRAFALKCS
jgi:WD40 repeat protein